MGAVDTALKYILNTVNETLLELAFREKHRIINNTLTLEEKIRTQVLVSKVLSDVKSLSGIRKNIVLSKCYIRQVADTTDYIVEIPDKLLGNREIVSASSISIVGANGAYSTSGNPLLDASMGIMASYDSGPSVTITTIENIGRNVLLVITEGFEYDLASGTMECTIASTNSMSHIHPRNYRQFNQLCKAAAESLIYNKLYVKLDEGYVKGGHNIGRIKDAVDKLEDAEDKYQELLDKWELIERLNSRKFNSDFISLQIGPT